jgi:hypothetical protein
MQTQTAISWLENKNIKEMQLSGRKLKRSKYSAQK